jgi:NADH dehydrogenase
MERNLPRSRKYALRFLEKHGVAVRLGKKIDTKGHAFFLDEKPLDVDVVFYCIGISPNTHIVPFPKNERGYIVVDEFVRVNPRVFAPGDLNSLAMEKTAQNAQRQALIVAENIKRTEAGKPLVAYTMKKTPMCVSLGRHDGSLEVSGFCITGFFPGMLKCMIEWWELFKLKHF